MDSNTDGEFNDAFGRDALGSGSGFDSCCAFGNSALKVNTGDDNAAFGFVALGSNTSGAANTAVGSQALDALTTASECVAVGADAGGACTTGIRNTFLGRDAGHNLTTGQANVFVGEACVASSVSVDVENCLGAGLTGKGNQTTFIGGTNGTFNNQNSQNFATTSDERIKKNIVDNNSGLDILNQIQVRNFEYRTEEEIVDFDNPKAVVVEKEGTQLGVIAQELEKILPECVITQSTGAKTVDADNLTWYLVNAVKELSKKVTALEAG